MLGVYEAYVRCQGQTKPVLVVVDLGWRERVAIGHLDERDPRLVERFLKPLVHRLGVSVIFSDDLLIYC